MRERAVLPRMADLITDILETIARLETGGDWECVVLHYSDAFKHLQINDEECRYLGGRALNCCFCYRVLLFGVKSGPLLWGRAGALLMRFTAGVNAQDKSRLQCVVDDPVSTVGGTKAGRARSMLRAILLWLVLGTR